MPQIEFIQFLGDKLRKKIIIDRPLDIAQMADALKANGFRLEAKNLGDGSVVIAVADATLDFLLASRTVPNGPELPAAVDGLIKDVHAVLAGRLQARREAAFAIKG